MFKNPLSAKHDVVALDSEKERLHPDTETILFLETKIQMKFIVRQLILPTVIVAAGYIALKLIENIPDSTSDED